MRNFRLVTVTEDKLRFIWEVHAYLESVKQIGWEHKVDVVIFKPATKSEYDKRWEIVAKNYPFAKFYFYQDEKIEDSHTLAPLIPIYGSIIRPYALMKHFNRYPDLEKEAIIYTDTDILFTKKPDIEKLIEDEINYVSDTVSVNDYMSHKYFESKRNDVDPKLLEEYDKRDIIEELARIVQIDKSVITENISNTGGVQYILKNINSDFWYKVMMDCIHIKVHLMNINQHFFPGVTTEERESKGFQSWCADLWATLWNLWYHQATVRCAPELEFAWATDKIEKLSERPNISILHNAGVTSTETMIIREGKLVIDAPAFYKGRREYCDNLKTPFTDLEYLQSVVANETSQKYCTYLYTMHLLDLQQKQKLIY